MALCEDFPCCGHTLQEPCDMVIPDYRDDPHLLCDHNTGYCEVVQYEDDDEDYDEDLDMEDDD